MSTYSYIGGTLKENPDPLFEQPHGRNFSRQDQEEYDNHIASLKTYVALNFPSSYVGRNDLELNKHLLLQHQYKTRYGWENCTVTTYDDEDESDRRIIAIPIEEKDHVPDVGKTLDKNREWKIGDVFTTVLMGFPEVCIIQKVDQENIWFIRLESVRDYRTFKDDFLLGNLSHKLFEITNKTFIHHSEWYPEYRNL